MSEQQPVEPGEGALTPPHDSLLPPPPATQYPPPAWAPPAPPAPPADSIWRRIAAFVVLLAIVAAAAGAGIGFSLARFLSPQLGGEPEFRDSTPIQAATPATGGSLNLTEIARKINPAIVDVNTQIGSSPAAGTGMIISPAGEVLTNNHVVQGSTSINVTIQGRSQSYTAHVIGAAPSQDVAVIQIEGVSGLPTVSFANSSSLQVGQAVAAIGNALGQGGAPHVTAGSVVALDQTITASEGGGNSEQLSGMIQSDAVIYPGDSGGALVNSAGQVIGMITAGQTEGFRSSASTVGYAIPSNTALSVANRIRAHEQSSDIVYGQQGYLGVSVQTLDAYTASQLGLNVTAGALVVSVQPASPAESAGITRYSVITSVGGSAVTSTDTLGTAVKSHAAGDQVQVTWVDQSGTHNANVTLAGVNP